LRDIDVGFLGGFERVMSGLNGRLDGVDGDMNGIWSVS
jgi:hypothetical protein